MISQISWLAHHHTPHHSMINIYFCLILNNNGERQKKKKNVQVTSTILNQVIVFAVVVFSAIAHLRREHNTEHDFFSSNFFLLRFHSFCAIFEEKKILSYFPKNVNIFTNAEAFKIFSFLFLNSDIHLLYMGASSFRTQFLCFQLKILLLNSFISQFTGFFSLSLSLQTHRVGIKCMEEVRKGYRFAHGIRLYEAKKKTRYDSKF